MVDIKVITNKKNELLKRKEIVAEELGKIVPAKKDLREKLAAQLNTSAEQIVITKVESKYGSHKSIITANVYDSKEDMKKNEGQPLLARNFEEFKKKKGTAPKTGPAP